VVNEPVTPAPRKAVWEQSWYKWCGVLLTSALTLLYAAAVRVFKTAPIYDNGTGTPRWFGLTLTYFCFPVAVLGLYMFCMALVGPFVRNKPQKKRILYMVVIGAPLATAALRYTLSSGPPFFLLYLSFPIGLFVIILYLAVATKALDTGKRRG
jgi:hypothetical protein